ncbi:MAG: mandelate racemase/muconate lactonizing enzyme family protein, partial [Candidatus Brocadiae bacterium]|nr:mandelate racemase/muconate lactonizing enzyme family protein [Candidatus Brocadiia bacterium]
PVAGGEQDNDLAQWRRMVAMHAVDIVQPDIPKVGGLLEAKKIADLADLYYIPIAAHNVSSPVGTMAACHTCAGMRNFVVMEFHCLDVPWWNDLVMADGPLIREGCITLPEEPGLGLELNGDVARAHLSEGATFFE